jgi:hypothetical protein
LFNDDAKRIDIHQLTRLAKVSERTVKNAISAGELVSFKEYSSILDEKITYITKESAYKWLAGRRNFKPTVVPVNGDIKLLDVSTPIAMRGFLKTQTQRLIENHFLEGDEKEAMQRYGDELANKSVIEMSEVKEISQQLRINYDALLKKVFEIYYQNELSILRSQDVKFA